MAAKKQLRAAVIKGLTEAYQWFERDVIFVKYESKEAADTGDERHKYCCG